MTEPNLVDDLIRMGGVVCADNLLVMRAMPTSTVDLIYLDPPFWANEMYVGEPDPPLRSGEVDAEYAFCDAHGFERHAGPEARVKDIWRWGDESQRRLAYLEARKDPLALLVRYWLDEDARMAAYMLYMDERLAEMERVLKPGGSVYLHCDWHASHVLRELMDRRFGRGRFQNEIVWGYPAGGRPPDGAYPRKHDTLFFYAGRDRTFNREYVEMNEQTLKSYRKLDEDGRLYKEYPGGRSYLDDKIGTPLPDWWDDIVSLGQAVSSGERTGYPTQKPEALLERIIKTSSNAGDVVLDPFSGSYTTLFVAYRLKRTPIGIEHSPRGITIARRRGLKNGLLLEGTTEETAYAVYGDDWPHDFEVKKHDWKLVEMRVLGKADFPARQPEDMNLVGQHPIPQYQLKREHEVRVILEYEQKCARCGMVVCAGCGRCVPGELMEMDHIIAKNDMPSEYAWQRAARDCIKNRILLCGWCNKHKGAYRGLAELREWASQDGSDRYGGVWMDDPVSARDAQRRALAAARAVENGTYAPKPERML